MKRRDFIRMSGYATVYLGVPFIAGCSRKPVNAAIDQPQFLMHIMDKKSITGIGKQYIIKMPDESSSGKLQTLLTEKADITGSTPAENVHEHFDKQSIADFNENKTVIVDGWVISVTEARQCALFSLEEK
jgi:hypothetical protein